MENDDYRSSIDHSRDYELGIIQTKGRLLNRYNKWVFSSLDREWHKEFDNCICYCASKDGKMIGRIYIFPWEEIIKRCSIAIYNSIYSSRGHQKYRVNDEKVITKVNEIWGSL